MEALVKSLAFCEERQRIIANNIANANTPFYKARRAPVAEFQAALGEAIRARKQRPGGEFELRSTRNIESGRDGLRVRAVEDRAPGAAILRHDENNVSLDREMAALAENTLLYRTMSDLLRKQFSILKAAVGEKVV